VAPQGVAGVCGVRNDPTLAHDLGSTADRPPLGVDGMQGEILGYRGDARQGGTTGFLAYDTRPFLPARTCPHPCRPCLRLPR
jgi:hypothetical protein